MRTLHFTNAWHASSGGVATFYRALLDAANQEGWHARLVVPSSTTRYEPAGPFAGIYHIRAPRSPFTPQYRVLYPYQYLTPGGAVREILRRERPDLIEICEKYTLPYFGGMLRRGLIKDVEPRPAVVGLSCERADESMAVYMGGGALARSFARAYMKCLYFPLFDHHIAISRHVADELEPASRGHKVSRGVWIRALGVDAELFHPRRRNAEVLRGLRARADASEQTALLLYAGRLAPEKNLPLLLDLLTALRGNRGEYKLLIAGDGPLRESFLAESRKRHPGSVVYLGHIAGRDQLADVIANVDAFLHPNPAEPYGIAPLEAMAAGVPLIAPDSGGVVSYANTANAWVVPATADDYALAVRSILHDRPERERRTLQARATAEKLHWREVCAGFHSLYWELCSRVQGRETAPSMAEPAFCSTPGNWLGMETSSPGSRVKTGRRWIP